MSYARFADNCYVYVYFGAAPGARRDGLVCCYCCLNAECESQVVYSTSGMVDHLIQHIRARHPVPWDVITELWADDTENFPALAC